MTIKELKNILNELPEEYDDNEVYLYESCGMIGSAAPVSRAYFGKTYTRDKGCRNTFQIQFDASDEVINKENFLYHIDEIKKSVNGEDYYLKESFPLPDFKSIPDALDYLVEHVNE